MRDLGGSGSLEQIFERVLQRGDSDEQQAALQKDGPSTEIEYRMAWARTKQEGLDLTDNSQRVVVADRRPIVEPEIEPKRQSHILKVRPRSRTSDAAESEETEPKDLTWQQQLLDSLMQLHPAAFERLVQRLLREAGLSQPP